MPRTGALAMAAPQDNRLTFSDTDGILAPHSLPVGPNGLRRLPLDSAGGEVELDDPRQVLPVAAVAVAVSTHALPPHLDVEGRVAFITPVPQEVKDSYGERWRK